MQPEACAAVSVCRGRTNDAQVVGVLCRVRKKAADFETALAVLGELKRRLHQVADGAIVRADDHVALVRRAVVFRQRRFGIERIHLAGSPVHKQEDDVLGFGGEVGFTSS